MGRWCSIAAFVLLAGRPSRPRSTAMESGWEACKAWGCCWAHVQGSGRLRTLFHPLEGLAWPCAGPRKPQNVRCTLTPLLRLGGPHHFCTAVGGRLLCLPIFSAFVAVQILGGSGGTAVCNYRIHSPSRGGHQSHVGPPWRVCGRLARRGDVVGRMCRAQECWGRCSAPWRASPGLAQGPGNRKMYAAR